MDAPRGSAEFEQALELERLRRRAYGPDPDIAGDAAAQARLSELEAARRQQATPVGEGDTASVPLPVGAFTEHERAPAVPWWRRRRSLIAGGALAALGLNVAFTVWMSQLLAQESTPLPAETAQTPRVPAGHRGGSYVPAPDHVLALRSDGVAADQPEDPEGKLDALGIGPDELKRYEDFPSRVGSLSVWSGESRYGMTCLLLAASGQPISGGGRAAEGCSLRGADTIADVEGSDSLTRFVLTGDHISVYVYEGGADPNASQG